MICSKCKLSTRRSNSDSTLNRLVWFEHLRLDDAQHVPQNKLSESNQEQEKLSIQLTSLQTQLGNAKEEVETEKDNCR